MFAKSIKWGLSAVILASSLLLAGCDSDWPPLFPTEYDKEKSKSEQLATVLSQDGNTYQLIKVNTGKDYAVFQNMTTGEYVAYNYNKYNPTTMLKAEDYLSTLAEGDIVHDLLPNTVTWDQLETDYYTEYYTDYETQWEKYTTYDYYCDCYVDDWRQVSVPVTKTREVPYTHWVTYTETFYQNGNFSFEGTDETPKDLETISGLMSQENSEQLASFVGTQYGLSASRASEVANLLVSFEEIKNTRGVTAEDLKSLQSELLGTDLSVVLAAKQKADQGDKKEYQNLVDQAANLNDVSPEQMQNILNKLF